MRGVTRVGVASLVQVNARRAKTRMHAAKAQMNSVIMQMQSQAGAPALALSASACRHAGRCQP